MTACSQERWTCPDMTGDFVRSPVCAAGSEPPEWLPEAARHYLLHIEMGRSIRAIARDAGCHASTISRQVRKVESRRDDPLVDTGLMRLGTRHFPTDPVNLIRKDELPMTAMSRIEIAEDSESSDSALLQDEIRLALRRMAETGAVLAVAAEMEKGVIMRSVAGGESTRTAVVSREVAETMALRDWIGCVTQGRISRYEITPAGRSALKRDAERRVGEDGFAEAVSPFRAQHGEWERPVRDGSSNARGRPRMNLAESPLAALARRRDKDGTPFLGADLVSAGERLREDFELAQMGPRVTQDWDRFMTAGASSGGVGRDRVASGPTAARDRVTAALGDLGPGLGDVVLRCCCYLEGMEAVERQMGWSARSGKIVLRIALQRLSRYYSETLKGQQPLIG